MPNCALQYDDSKVVRSSVGVSLIWASPFGPLRLDYATPLTKGKYDTSRSSGSGEGPRSEASVRGRLGLRIGSFSRDYGPHWKAAGGREDPSVRCRAAAAFRHARSRSPA
nr:BamA/TamA family outer membrane protein [Bradyrhizobium sp. cir1]